MTPPPPSPGEVSPEATSTLHALPDRRGVAWAAAWLVAGAAGVRLIDGYFADNPAAAAVLGAFLVDLLAGRAGVRWSEQGNAPWWPSGRRGLALGATIGMVLLAVGQATGWATLALGAPSPSLLFAAVRVAASATRDELLFRVLPVVLGRRARVPGAALAAFCALAAALPMLATHAAPASVAMAAAQGLLGAQLALATRGAFAPIAANAGLALALGPMSRGGVLDMRWWQGDPGPAPLAQGAIGWIAAVLLTLAAVFLAPRLAAPPSGGEA